MKSISILISILFSMNAFANFDVYSLKITRDGETKKRVAFNNWSGEYPGPVIKVTKTTTIEGVNSVRTEKPKAVKCTLDKGIYHMWANKQAKQVINYYTLTNYLAAEIVGDVSDEAIWHDEVDETMKDLQKGEVISHIYYGAEGWCGGKMKREGKMRDVSFDCFEVLESPQFKMISEDKDWEFHEQWLYLSCQEGHNAFIQDIEFLKQKNVVQGQITGFGSVE